MILAGARAAVLGFRQTCYTCYAMFAGHPHMCYDRSTQPAASSQQQQHRHLRTYRATLISLGEIARRIVLGSQSVRFPVSAFLYPPYYPCTLLYLQDCHMVTHSTEEDPKIRLAYLKKVCLALDFSTFPFLIAGVRKERGR
jgi:hypothetical protein